MRCTPREAHRGWTAPQPYFKPRARRAPRAAPLVSEEIYDIVWKSIEEIYDGNQWKIIETHMKRNKYYQDVRENI